MESRNSLSAVARRNTIHAIRQFRDASRTGPRNRSITTRHPVQMGLSLTRIPFYSVCLAALLPWVNGLTNSNAPGYLFDLVLIGLAGTALALDQNLRFRGRLSSWVFGTAFCFGLVMLFILHRTHFLNTALAIVPVTLAYVIFLSVSTVNPAGLLRQLKWLYSLHIAFIALELLLFLFDLQYVLQALSGERYRNFYFSLLSRLTTDFRSGAPNSLLLQAQAAGHLVVAAFLLFYLAPIGRLRRSNLAALSLLVLLFVMAINNTSLLIFIVLFSMIWLVRARLYSRLLVICLLPFVAYLFLDQILSAIFFQIYDGLAFAQIAFDTYVWLFTIPIANVFDAQPLQLLFGHGSDTDALESGELGFATVAFNFGVYTVGLLSIWLASHLIAGFMRHQRLKDAREPLIVAWNSLLFVNIVLCAAWALSTAHYLILLIPGGTHLFAFSLAVVITANTRLRLILRSLDPEHRLNLPSTPVAPDPAHLRVT